MECPECNHEVMSFGQFFMKLNPLRAECNHCGAVLKADIILIAYFFIGIALGAVLGFSFGYFMGGIIVADSIITKFLIILGIGLAVFIPFIIAFAYAAWKHGHYI